MKLKNLRNRMEIGVDIVSVVRIKKIIEKWGDKFLERIYTSKEKTFCLQRKNFEECFAGRFAAKEAVFKAFGDINLRLKDIEIVERKVYIKGNLNENIKVSISHEKDYAISVAVINN